MQYLHEVRVSLQAATGVAEGSLLASQLPDQESLVSRGADDHGVVVKRRAAENTQLLQAQKFYNWNLHSSHLAEMAVTQPLWPFMVPANQAHKN